MKKVTKILGGFALCALLATSTPALAQTSDNASGTTTTTTNHDEDTGKWGLAGLLGLLGLLGLRKKDDNLHRTTTNVNR